MKFFLNLTQIWKFFKYQSSRPLHQLEYPQHITRFFFNCKKEKLFSFFSFILDVQIYTAKLLWGYGERKREKAHNNKFTKSFVDQT